MGAQIELMCAEAYLKDAASLPKAAARTRT
jgi:hypothetical protein